VARRLAERPEDLPPATVIVPVKGYDEGLRENLAALAALDYPDYELIVTAHSAGDIPPGRAAGAREGGAGARHGPAGAEKIQNLMAAVRAARKRSQVLAFADSDGRVTRGWLRALVAPLAEPGVGASTGYRWFLPDPPDFWSLMRGVWDAVAAGTLGAGRQPFRLGRRHGDPQRSVLRSARSRVLAGRAERRLRAQPGRACRRAQHRLRSGRAHPVPEHITGGRFFGWI
jgi:hypothetical protein